MNEVSNTYIPRYVTRNAIITYFLLLFTINILYWDWAMEWYFVLIGSVQVIGFFYVSNLLSKKWYFYPDHYFAQNIFVWSLVIRVAYVIFSYFFYIQMTGEPFEFYPGDVIFYNDMGRYGASLIDKGEVMSIIPLFQKYTNVSISDMGYPIYLSFVYYFTDNSIFVARLLKAVWSAWTVLLVYKLAQRNFGEQTARMAGILCMLMPNLIHYCGLHLKEVEMLFLMMVFIERGDYIIRQGKFVLIPIAVMAAAGLYMFMFRTALAVVLFLAFFMALVMTSTRVVNWGRRIITIILALLMTAVFFTDTLESEVKQVTNTDVRAQQQKNMQWRASRANGNKFAKYAGAAVFAPMIFTIPFPTMVATYQQENMRMIHGGNFVKNVTSMFTIIAMLLLIWPYDWKKNLLQGEWRKHILPIAVLGGYLVVLVFSAFAQAERFHLPTVPLAMMFAAYGMSRFNNKWRGAYYGWLFFIFLVNLAWAFVKLAGRGIHVSPF